MSRAPGDGAGLVLLGGAHVDDDGAVGDGIRRARATGSSGLAPRAQVVGDVAEHVDGVLGRGELRRVGQLEVGEGARGEAAGDRGRDDVDALVDAVAADALGAEDRVGVGVDEQLQAHPLGAGVVGRVRRRVRVDDAVAGGRRRTRRFSFQPVVGDLQAEDADDRGAEHRAVAHGQPGDDVGDHAGPAGSRCWRAARAPATPSTASRFSTASPTA